MARLRGFEPLTRRFVVCYSIQLSYRRTSGFARDGMRHHNGETQLLPANLSKVKKI